MPLDIVTVPCRSDNYAFLVKVPDTNTAILVDAPETAPIEQALASRGWTLAAILITHHHHDHVAGVADLRAAHSAPVVGPLREQDKLPTLDHAVSEGDDAGLGILNISTLEVPGHTLGHVAYVMPDANAVFTADSLMAMGCGRLFEGTAAQMWDSLSKLAALPSDTIVCSGHEYTQANARFAATIDPQNAALKTRSEEISARRARNEPTVPSLLSDELATNPFLRAGNPEIRAHLNMSNATDEQVFAEIRRRKDAF